MVDFAVKDFNRESFPAIYRCADHASIIGQYWYAVWVKVNLSLLFGGAIAGSIVFGSAESKQIAQIVVAVFFFSAMGTTILLANRRWERIWYSGRAVAESAKSLTWKFICGAAPFSSELHHKTAIELFTRALGELLSENKQLAGALAGPDATGEQVTAFMLNLRSSATGVRRDVFLSQRVSEQQRWYAEASASNRRRRNIWFALLVIFQCAAGAAAIILAVYPDFPWRATSAFSTLASLTIAWGQMKRYQELAQAYGLAAQELSLIAALGSDVSTSEELARFVNDAETAISREHAMWAARREVK